MTTHYHISKELEQEFLADFFSEFGTPHEGLLFRDTLATNETGHVIVAGEGLLMLFLKLRHNQPKYIEVDFFLLVSKDLPKKDLEVFINKLMWFASEATYTYSGYLEIKE